MKFPRLKEFIAFTNERWAIHQRRLAGKEPPWTKDEILQKYRFTNVKREDDRVTRFIHEQWMVNSTSPDLWFAFYFARVLNRERTLTAVGWPLPWTAAMRRRVYNTLMRLKDSGQPVFSAAYLVSSHGQAAPSKVDYYDCLWQELWLKRRRLRPTAQDTLGTFADRLIEQRGLGSFMAAQVVADLKPYSPLKDASDCVTFARKGPGSHRGLNWVVGRDQHTGWPGTTWLDALLELREKSLPNLAPELRNLDAQNLQNCLCEVSKYFKVKYLDGLMRQKFTPSTKPYMSGL
jgi:hypothetical protein